MNKAFDYLFDALVITDLKGIITDWNKGSETLYGYSKKKRLVDPSICCTCQKILQTSLAK
nr:PAS domain S-box protein [Psychromonas hadalis]